MRDFLIMDCLFLVISNDKTREELLSTHDLQDKAVVERLIETVNFLSKFVLKLSGVIRPIYDLARPTFKWMWDAVH